VVSSVEWAGWECYVCLAKQVHVHDLYPMYRPGLGYEYVEGIHNAKRPKPSQSDFSQVLLFLKCIRFHTLGTGKGERFAKGRRQEERNGGERARTDRRKKESK
jgi:hypothetical protein